MSASPSPAIRLNVPDFLSWAAARPQGSRYELVDGEVVQMAPERVGHNLVKFAVARALDEAIRGAKLDCTVFTDGITVAIDDHTAREPDASVQCGPIRSLDSLTIDEPVIVVEVTSPSSLRTDEDHKLVEYFSLASVQHYLVVHPKERVVVHHARDGAAEIRTRIVRDGTIELSPPGFSVAVSSFFGEALQ